MWPVTRRHLSDEVRQLSTLGGRGITIDRIHLSLDKLLTRPRRPRAERSAENTRKLRLNFVIFWERLAE